MRPGNVPTILLGLLSVPLVSTASAASQGEATFAYALGSQAQGHIEATCGGKALFLPAYTPGTATLVTSGGVLHVYETWENYTVVAGWQILTGANEQTERTLPVPAGPLTVSWGERGRVAVLEAGALRQRTAPFPIELRARALAAGPVTNDVDTGDYWVQRGDTIYNNWGAVGGFARPIRLEDGQVRVNANVTVYLEGAHMEGPNGFAATIPPKKEIVTQNPTPWVGVWTVRYHHALLDLNGAALDWNRDDLTLACAGLEGRVEGRFAAYDAHGVVRVGERAIEFQRRELELEGTFQYAEHPEPLDPSTNATARMMVSGSGGFRAVSLDFGTVAGGAHMGSALEVLVAVGAAGAVGYALWKLLGLYFTRLRLDRLLEAPTRRRVYEAVQANPAATIPELTGLVGLSSYSLRYQVRVLERHGLVRWFKLGGAYRIVSADRNVDAFRRQLAGNTDEKVRALVARVGLGSVPAGQAVQELRARWGLSRSGGWKVVERAWRAQLIRKEKTGREVVLRAA